MRYLFTRCVYIHTCPSHLGMCGDIMLKCRGVGFVGLERRKVTCVHRAHAEVEGSDRES